MFVVSDAHACAGYALPWKARFGPPRGSRGSPEANSNTNSTRKSSNNSKTNSHNRNIDRNTSNNSNNCGNRGIGKDGSCGEVTKGAS